MTRAEGDAGPEVPQPGGPPRVWAWDPERGRPQRQGVTCQGPGLQQIPRQAELIFSHVLWAGGGAGPLGHRWPPPPKGQ